MDDVIRLLSVTAWPLVVLAAVIVLGPGGLLMRFAESLGAAVSNFTKSLPELKTTALTMRADADILAAKSKDMADLFATEVRKIEEQIENLAGKTTLTLRELKETIQEIDQSRVIDSQHQIQKATDLAEPFSAPVDLEVENVDTIATPDEMWDEIKYRWSDLCDKLRENMSNPEDFDRRQVGAIAWRLADRRRSNPISKEQAELIQELHTQFKRFTRLAATRDEWLLPEVFTSFISGLNLASGGLD